MNTKRTAQDADHGQGTVRKTGGDFVAQGRHADGNVLG